MAKIKILAVFLILILDRLTKWYILDHPDLFLGDFIQLKLVKNPNLYFLPLNNLLVSLVASVILFLLLILFFKNKELSFGLIILGGGSNLFDRLYYGFVIDWIKLFPFSFFNLADAMIVLGVLIIGLRLLLRKK